MSAENEVWDGREIVGVDECDRWRARVRDGESAAQVARDVAKWGYSTVHEHVGGGACEVHGDNHVPPAETSRDGGYGLPVVSNTEERAVREGLRDALAANVGDTATIRIKSFRKRRDIDVRGQVIGVAIRELESGDPRGEFDVRDNNPDAQVGRWSVRYTDGFACDGGDSE